MRYGCILVGAALLMFMLGIEKTHEAFVYSRPKEITSQQFMLSAPKEGWYKIKGCELKVEEGVYLVNMYATSLPSPDSRDKQNGSETSHSHDKTEDAEDASRQKKPGVQDADKTPKSHDPPDDWVIRMLFIPIHSAATFNSQTFRYPLTNLVLQTRDPAIIAMANALIHLKKQTPQAAAKWLAANRDKLLVRRDVVGLVQTSSQADVSVSVESAGLQDTLTSDYRIVNENKTPSFAAGLAGLVLGLLLGLIAVVYWMHYIGAWNRRLTY